MAGVFFLAGAFYKRSQIFYLVFDKLGQTISFLKQDLQSKTVFQKTLLKAIFSFVTFRLRSLHDFSLSEL